MSSDAKQGKGYTAPKGRPTVHRTPGRSTRRMSSTLEWALAAAVIVAVLAAVFYFGRNFRSTGGGTSMPAAAVVVEGTVETTPL